MSGTCSPNAGSIGKAGYDQHFNAVFIGFFLLCFIVASHHLCIAVRSAVEKLRRRGRGRRRECHRDRETFEEVKAYKDVYEVTENPTRRAPAKRSGTRGHPAEALTCDSGEKAVEVKPEPEEFLHEKEIRCEAERDSGVGAADQRVEEEETSKYCAAKEESSQNLTQKSSGKTGKDKEWNRTLAHMLFEERNNGGGSSNISSISSSEGMDSLWETYEAESNGTVPKNDAANEKTTTTKKISTKTKLTRKKTKKGIDFGGEDEHEESSLCCLRALRLSAGKMNMGMRRSPNGLAKITKALKGVGWLKHASRRARKHHHSQ